MEDFRRIMDNNRRWVTEVTERDPEFSRHVAKQEPDFLYIGCADSRVPAEVLTGLQPGELFVHRNIANQVIPSDLNALSVLQYAVDVLDVKHIIVVGHYGCGGVKAAMGDQRYGLVDQWLGHIRNVIRWNSAELDAITDEQARFNRVVELNVIEQIYQISQLPTIQEVWSRGRRPLLHGLVYDIRDGLLREVVVDIDSQAAADDLASQRRARSAAQIVDHASPADTNTLADAIADRVAERLANRAQPATTDA